MSVGHSLGSALAAEEARTYHDVDALVPSGFLHSLGPGVEAVGGALYPAAFDPKFAGTITDQGYLTTQPGLRGVFYRLPGADPAASTTRCSAAGSCRASPRARSAPTKRRTGQTRRAWMSRSCRAGHDVNLHRSAPPFFVATQAWIATHAGY